MTLKEILDIESQNSEQMDSKPTIKRERNKVDKIERENIFHPNNLYYNSAGDYYICPMGQKNAEVWNSEECFRFRVCYSSGKI
jgi:hypothetical protein